MNSRSPRRVAAAERPMSHIALIAVLCALMLSACHGRPTPEVRAGDAAPDTSQLGPGDDVRINVFGDESLSGEHKVAGDGALAMPLVGRVQAAGLPATEPTASLESPLAEYTREPPLPEQILTTRPF